jgi:hypothetical protein
VKSSSTTDAIFTQHQGDRPVAPTYDGSAPA